MFDSLLSLGSQYEEDEEPALDIAHADRLIRAFMSASPSLDSLRVDKMIREVMSGSPWSFKNVSVGNEGPAAVIAARRAGRRIIRNMPYYSPPRLSSNRVGSGESSFNTHVCFRSNNDDTEEGSYFYAVEKGLVWIHHESMSFAIFKRILLIFTHSVGFPGMYENR